MAMTNETSSMRERWGFNDARADLRHSRSLRDVSDHFDIAYATGYEAGVERNEFWLQHQNGKG